MITEAQRRALFALREALELCHSSRISVKAETEDSGHVRVSGSFGGCFSLSNQLNCYDIDRLLQEFPEQ